MTTEHLTARSVYESGTINRSGEIYGGGITYNCHDYYWHHWYPYTQTIVYRDSVPEKNKLEVAFKIVQKLIDKKLVKITAVKSFVDLVGEVAEIV